MITFSGVRNPIYTDSGVDCEVLFNHIEEWIPFHATPYDTEPHGREIYQLCMAGTYGSIGDAKPKPVEVPLTAEQKLNRLGLTKEDLKALVK